MLFGNSWRCARVSWQRTRSRKGQRACIMSFCLFNGGEKFKDHFKPGIYVCGKCGYELFSSRSKYEHSSPWPAFTETVHEDSISKKKEDRAAYKVSCGKCGYGLGHEFINDGPQKGQSRF